ncbi:type VI secretion system protein TssL, long form [Variovorax sp. J22R133]|uniref:type VI secretion system protein TssL, long form n=1 Tax=Variovorax brevis TaxID=3053503 RepID=UPI002578A8D1|nr:type VI secretion system protein TssL, long form [Variovorax sp. J22R133]MDM0112098.1 type VI secretion system protein TssL, long form [Variovorax sp. J22R133]
MFDNNSTQEIAGGTSGLQPRADQDDRVGEAAASGDIPLGVQLAPEPSAQVRLTAVKAAQNPLLEAAQPLLRALADMPAKLEPTSVRVLHRLLEREVVSFQSLCSHAQIKHEHMVAASYSLCTALDEAANSTQWGGGQGGEAGVWASQQLAAQFHGDTKGGDKFFLLVGRLAASPKEHTDLLELMYQILGVGFEGRFSTATNGRRQLETIRHRLLTLLAAARGDVPNDLSPHWKGVGTGKFRLLRSIPVWVTFSLLALALLGIFGWYKYQLTRESGEVVHGIEAIGQLRPPQAAPAPPHKPLRLKELLSAEIARGTVSVDEDDKHSTVTFKGDDMFVPGQARLNAKILPVLAKVAEEINNVSGTVFVTGHSDDRPIKTREFPNNQVLSEKRAAAVADVFKEKGVDASRIQTEGRGDTTPVADNKSAAGRAKNRRVDVVVTQGGDASPSRSDATPAPAASAPARAASPAGASGAAPRAPSRVVSGAVPAREAAR